MAEVAKSFVTIVPKIASGFASQLEGQMDATKVGQSSGASAGKGFSAGVLGNLKGIATGIAGAFAVKAVTDFGKDAISSFKTVGGEVRTLQRTIGGSVEDASRLRFAFSQVGLSTDDAGVALKKLEVGIANNTKNWQQLGINARDAAGNVRPMSELLPQIAERFKAMPDGAEKTALAVELFGKSGTNMIPILNKGAAGMKDLMAQSDAMGMTLGTKQVAALADAAKSQRTFDAALEGTKVQIGAQLLPVATDMMNLFRERMIPIIVQVTGFVRDHGKELGIVAGIIVALIVPLGGFIGLMKTVSTVQTAASTAMSLFKVATVAQSAGTVAATGAQWGFNAALLANPIVLVIAAIALLVAGLVWFFTQTEVGRNAWSSFMTWLGDTWNGIVKTATAAWTGLTAFFAGLWTSITTGLTQAWNGVIAFFTGLWTSITTTAQAAWTGFQQMLAAAWAIIGPIVTVPLTVWSTLFTATWETIKAAAAAAFLILVGLFTGNFGLIGQAVQGFATTFNGIWAGAWATITGAASAAWAVITGLFSAAWSGLVSMATSAWATMTSTISAGVSSAVSFVATLPGLAASALSSLGSSITSVASSAWSSFTSSVQTGISNTLSLVSGLPGRAVSALGNIGSLLVSAGQDMIRGFISGIQNMAGSLVSAARGVVDGAINAAKKLLGIASPSRVFMQIGEYTGEGMTIGMGRWEDKVASAGDSLASAAIPSPRAGEVVAPRGQQGVTVNGPLVHVERMEVRSEDDIRSVSAKLQAGIDAKLRAGGSNALVLTA